MQVYLQAEMNDIAWLTTVRLKDAASFCITFVQCWYLILNAAICYIGSQQVILKDLSNLIGLLSNHFIWQRLQSHVVFDILCSDN
jgi:hypothetical protein